MFYGQSTNNEISINMERESMIAKEEEVESI